MGRGPTVGSPWSSSTPSSLGRGRVASPPPTLGHSEQHQKLHLIYTKTTIVIIANYARIIIFLPKADQTPILTQVCVSSFNNKLKFIKIDRNGRMGVNGT